MERRRNEGFTLLEAIAVLAVLSLLLTAGIPSYNRLRAEMQAAAARHELTTSLAFARSAAISYAKAVAVCPVDAAQRCRPDAVWEHGWMIYLDPDRSGQPERSDDILRFVDDLEGRMRVRGSAGRPQVRFQADGRSAGSTLTLRICADDMLMNEVILSNSGRPRSTDRRADAMPCALE